ncbi:MAG: cobalt-precorrin-5B (C(1))-methyltransferase CbiD [Clostridia bacterium]|nr:cobalt-precorrin-5B (C(1))-methyltransferase CbiD [Clostridia bacterium]
MDEYVVINGKKYRKGYTTGSCAAAASKAAVMMLVLGKQVDRVSIDTPAGVRLTLDVTDVAFSPGSVKCSVLKDGGDDPDMTSGLKVFAEAYFSGQKGVRVLAGEGIGTVTLPGLKVEAGKPAINPVPMKMILKEVQEVFAGDNGVEILLSVPGGRKISENTYNPKLGIVGGISILGTTGIVTPMSEEAWKESIAMELDIAAARGYRNIVFTFGNYGENFAVKQLGVHKEKVIKISNFVGYMLDKAVHCQIEGILLVGHLGKLIKVASGIFHTHSRVADARMETLSAYAALEGADIELVRRVYACKTTDAAAALIQEAGIPGVFDRVAESAARKCREYTFNKIRCGTVLFNKDDSLLSTDTNAKEILKEIRSCNQV